MTTSLWNAGGTRRPAGPPARRPRGRRRSRGRSAPGPSWPRRWRSPTSGRLGGGGEADLVVDDQVDGAADPVALDVAQVERLGHHALAGEGGVAVDAGRAAPRTLPGRFDLVLLGAAMPTTTGSTASRCDGLAASSTGWSLPLRAVNLPGLAEVVLHVARALGGVGVDVALELLEDLVVGSCRRCWRAR
jgi:hypothetical protein